MSVKQDKHARYREAAMKSCPPQEPERTQFLCDLEEAIAHFEHEDARVAAGKCPVCSGPITTRVDPRQHGPVETALMAGKWVNYRCAANPPIGTFGPRKCKWTGFDRKEPMGEN